MTTTAVIEKDQPATEPMELMRIAIEKGTDADQLRQLVALQEQWRKDRAREAYVEAFNLAQKAMPVIFKDAVNKHTKSRYAKLETIMEQIRPIYSDHGFSMSFGTAESNLQGHVRIICDVRHRLGHCEHYQADIPLDGTGSQGNKSSMNAPQATGSTYSYGQRYLAKLIWNLTIAGEDDDGNGEVRGMSEEQQAELHRLVEQAKPKLDKFLRWIGANDLNDLTEPQFYKASYELLRQIREQARKAAAAKGGA